ncbi:DUF2336 domain-containing protein [Rhodoblastus acidophilus]|uniref:DUF2336 domain-containing protein n=1 Tax=Candidatus Rhodoblastus alkanivorans TaxID=2954117 RepID=A0ABS9ZB03_9HYPH|nr:DUF2336 domain-containing protein [Candidatus Rhodoblastus alkanivorans]MCI4677916.1 DUF2336 domain-containing protein [Candidatus Rhodoblastus alkanivorans]MCI4683812.1 DUF2336 domain-containing protein [Candidatus Rhodoblastus alkanivorans]MDI4641130.1 DUF2336 domain-containing protein [Rhodoblastus acidophilus]
MIVRKFIQWSENAPASARAEGVGTLARAYLYGEIKANERAEAEQMLYGVLDDPSPLVRRALAESFAGALDAPPAVVLGLALDQSDIASLVLARSPLLNDAQLIDCAAVGDSVAQAAIALRHELSPAVGAALAEIATREALIALAVNEGANLPEFAMRRMIERFGDDAELREALLGRPWIPGAVRAAIADAAARQLARHAVARNWLSPARSERVAKDSRERAAMIIAAGCAAFSEETAALAAYLRVSGQLTAGLALRALLCGQTGLFVATLVELTGLIPRRVEGIIREPASTAFDALYARAGLPQPLLLAFRAALAALTGYSRGAPGEILEDGGLRLPVIEKVLAECEAAHDDGLARLIALLRRFEADAAREASRRTLARLRAEPAEWAAPPVSIAGPDAAPALQPQGKVEPMTEPLADTDIVVDLVALEKELMAA